MVSPATGIEDAGGDWYHEGGIILSKKPPEWHLSPPLHEFRVRFCYSLPQRRMARLQRPWRQRSSASDTNFRDGKEERPAGYNIAAARKNGPTAE